MSSKKEAVYFSIEKKALKILGISFTGNEHISYKIYSFLLLALVNYCYPFMALSDLFKHDFDTAADILVYEFGTFMGMAKTTVVLLNRIKIGKVLDKLEQAPFLPNSERGGNEEKALIKKCVKITRVQTITYWILVCCAISIAVSYSLFKRLSSNDYHDWQFTYGPVTVINVTYSPNFEILWFYQNISLTFIGIHFSTIDVMMAAVLAHLSFQFKMLQNYIRRSVENSYKMMPKNYNQFHVKSSSDFPMIPWKYLKVTLKDIVNYHLAILNIANEVEDVFNRLLLFMCFATMGMVCFSIYHASWLPPNDLRFMRTLIEAFSVCFQIGLLSYWGEQILFESQNVRQAAFEANFVGVDLKYQKGLMLIMRRSLKPTKLTAGKFALIDLATFTWFLKTSYSAFMVLYNSNSKETH